jgi:hypothetical protein
MLAVKTSFQLHVPKLFFRPIRKPDRVLIERTTACKARVNAQNTARLSGKSTEDHRPDPNPVTRIESGIGPFHRHLHKLVRFYRFEQSGETLDSRKNRFSRYLLQVRLGEARHATDLRGFSLPAFPHP